MDLISWLLVFGMVVVVPLGLDLAATTAEQDGDATRLRQIRSAAPAAGLLAGFSVVPPAGRAVVLLALPWILLTLLTAVIGVRAGIATIRRDPRDLGGIGWAAALAYLAVGGIWLLFDRAGIRPLGLSPLIVLLTAMHFHFAGFAASLIVSRTWDATVRTSPRLADTAVALTVGGPPMVAIGFAAWWPAQVIGALTITMGLLITAALLFWTVRPDIEDRRTRTLLTVAALAVVVPMFLAVQWAVGSNTGAPHLSIPEMARTHGVLNAIGFSFCGLLGWRRHEQRAAS